MLTKDFYTGDIMNPPTNNDNTTVNDAAFGAQYYAPSYIQQPYPQYGYNQQSMYSQQPQYTYQQPYQQQYYNPQYSYPQPMYNQQPYGYGGYGYQQPMYAQQPYGYQQQPQYGNYQQPYPNYNPYMQYQQPYQRQYYYNPQYGYQYQYGYQQPMYGYVNGQPQPYSRQPENAIGSQYDNQQPQEITYVVKGNDPLMAGEYMPNAGYEEEIRNLTLEYYMKEIEDEVDRNNNIRNRIYGESMFGFGNNYYNMPYYNSGNNAVRSEATRKIEEMKEEARENKLNFTVKMMKAAYDFKGIDVTEEELRERYSDKTVTIKDPAIINAYYPRIDPLNERLGRMVPFEDPTPIINNNLFYMVEEQRKQYIPDDCTLEEFLDKIGGLRYEYWHEKEMKKERMHGNTYYNGQEYGSFLKESARRRYEDFKNNKIEAPNLMQTGNGNYRGVPVPRPWDISDKFINMSKDEIINYNKEDEINNNHEPFGVLRQCASLSEDGTLNITFNNFGRDNPAKYNSEEKQFIEDRERFLSFVDRIAPSYVNEAKDKVERMKRDEQKFNNRKNDI